MKYLIKEVGETRRDKNREINIWEELGLRSIMELMEIKDHRKGEGEEDPEWNRRCMWLAWQKDEEVMAQGHEKFKA